MSPRVLVFGGSGMLGHKLWLTCRERFETWATVRSRPTGSVGSLFDDSRVIADVHATDQTSAVRAIAAARPTVVVNCIGIVKQLPAAKDPLTSVRVNALWPHELAALCAATGARVIHISTDCVFSGRKGRYVETDVPDAEDLYGRSKLLGELDEAEGLTLRTSIVGRELSGRTGLVEWFLGERGGAVRGYTRAVFSGLTTRAFATVVADVIERDDGLAGIYHVAAAPIDKHDLLCRLREAFGIAVSIQPDASLVIDRSLDAERFWQATGEARPDWDEMIEGLVSDPTPYEAYRSGDGAGR